ncbi:MAG: hypothetical protein Q9178_005806 [Gyalolechia marmorata]
MDFIEGVGQRYLMGKANAVPQQLETLAKKQFKGDTSAKAEPAAPNVGNGKNKEIDELREQLAKAKAAQLKPPAAPDVGNGKKKEIEELRKQLAKAKAIQQKPGAGSDSGKSAKGTRVPHHVDSKKSPPSHHAESKRSDHKSTAAREAYEKSAPRGATSVRDLAFPSHSASHRQTSASHSDQKNRSMRAAHGEIPWDEDQTPVMTSQSNRGTMVPASTQVSISEQRRPAADLCVVEVTEEKPLRHRQAHRQAHQEHSNVVEVIERRGSRTRYIVR